MNVGLSVLGAVVFPANFSKIRSLWLDNSNLTKLEDRVFKNMKYLKRLSLSSNYITEINPSLFLDLSSLKYLDLRNNCLVSPLHNDVFKSLSQIRTLKLDYNKLTTLDSKILTPFTNNIIEITLSNNPFFCDCRIRDTVEWFRRYGLSSSATCGYPNAGESWNTITFTGHCEPMSNPVVDLTCHIASKSGQEGPEIPHSFPVLFVLVLVISGFLLLLCGGLALYCWRRAARSSTPNIDRRINESKLYDDIRPSDDYYYETVEALPRYMSFVTSSRPGSAPEIPKRPQMNRTELHISCQTKSDNDVGNVRSSVSDSDSYIPPDNPTTEKETAADKFLASGEYLVMSGVYTRPGDLSTATGDRTLVSKKPVQSFRYPVNVTDEEKEDAISPLPSEAMTPTPAVRFDRRDIIEFQHVQTEESKYPWTRQSFWKS
jgi:hypothetical protein